VDSSDSTAALDNAQNIYQARRSSGLHLHLARSIVTGGQLGLAVYSLIHFHLVDQESLRSIGDAYYSLLGDSSRVVSWVYALALSLVYLIRPAVAHQFWIRCQLDLFYMLTAVLSTVQLARSDVLTLPIAKWPLRLQIEAYIWLIGALLIWISLLTLPYQPLTSARKLKQGEIVRPAPLEYASSVYSQLTFSWVNPLVYLGYKRSLQDTDLPYLEVTDESHTTVRQFKLNQYVFPPPCDNGWGFFFCFIYFFGCGRTSKTLRLRMLKFCNRVFVGLTALVLLQQTVPRFSTYCKHSRLISSQSLAHAHTHSPPYLWNSSPD
jgi:hypothetical protein